MGQNPPVGRAASRRPVHPSTAAARPTRRTHHSNQDSTLVETSVSPPLKPGARPGVLGWIGVTPATTAPPSSVAVIEAVAPTVVKRTFPLKLKLEHHDAPTMVRTAHRAYPDWDRARIGQELGLPDWYVSIVLAMSCKRHREHS